MKFLVKILLVLVVLAAGCYYFKVGFSVDNGIKVMNTTYNQDELFGKVASETIKLNPPKLNSLTYWEIPFANKYYVASDINFCDLSGKTTESGLYVYVVNKEKSEDGKDLTKEFLKTKANLYANSTECINWLLFVFGALSLVILFFPTGKKKRR